jgi:hypothetical protein
MPGPANNSYYLLDRAAVKTESAYVGITFYSSLDYALKN